MILKSSEYEIDNNEYSINSGWIETTLTKQPVPILYLPWWDNNKCCIACNFKLIFSSDNQKYCRRCCLIYNGCRYCLVTNIIFGIADQSQCRKCKRTLSFDVTKVSSGNHDLDEFLYDQKLKTYNNLQLDEIISNIKSNNQKEIYGFVKNKLLEPTIEWIPYSQISDMKKIAEGGFGIIYKAKWSYTTTVNHRKKNEIVVIKQFKNFQNISKYFLNEVCIFNVYIFLNA